GQVPDESGSVVQSRDHPPSVWKRDQLGDQGRAPGIDRACGKGPTALLLAGCQIPKAKEALIGRDQAAAVVRQGKVRRGTGRDASDLLASHRFPDSYCTVLDRQAERRQAHFLGPEYGEQALIGG